MRALAFCLLVGLPLVSQADSEQQAIFSGELLVGTCDLTITPDTITFADAVATDFGTVVGSNSGEVQHFSLTLSHCATNTGNLQPTIIVNNTDYHDSGAYAGLWRGVSSVSSVGFVIRRGLFNGTAAADWGGAGSDFIEPGQVVEQEESGSTPEGMHYDYSLVMGCGQCQGMVTPGKVTASLTFTFDYE